MAGGEEPEGRGRRISSPPTDGPAAEGDSPEACMLAFHLS
jgi:hypothetical protein